MKVCTDACLFGAYVASKNIPANTILDIGTGTGLLSLMLAQKITASIDAIELDKDAAEQATENVNNSPWKERITIKNSSIQEHSRITQKKYDLIICNPPFYENSLKSPDTAHNKAIHAETLSLTELADAIINLLNKQGVAALLLPPYESSLFKNLAEAKGLYLNEVITIKDNAEDKVIREMSFYSLAIHSVHAVNHPSYQQEIIIKDNNNYSPKFTSLLKDYYLYL